jgi:hypothetical protein
LASALLNPAHASIGSEVYATQIMSVIHTGFIAFSQDQCSPSVSSHP